MVEQQERKKALQKFCVRTKILWSRVHYVFIIKYFYTANNIVIDYLTALSRLFVTITLNFKKKVQAVLIIIINRDNGLTFPQK